MSEFDEIDRAEHYNVSPAECKQGHQIECIDVIQHMDLPIGNVIKYIWRAGLKPDSPCLKDLKKAAYYLQCRIALEEKKLAKGEISEESHTDDQKQVEPKFTNVCDKNYEWGANND